MTWDGARVNAAVMRLGDELKDCCDVSVIGEATPVEGDPVGGFRTFTIDPMGYKVTVIITPKMLRHTDDFKVPDAQRP